MAINLKVSENQERVPLRVGGGGLTRTISPDDGSPYYVGARAYVTQTADGATITVIDKEGTTTANISNGADGEAGATGTDGFSPIATVEKVDDTATITITDKYGTTTASISDGSGGGTGDYEDLENQPQINSVTLVGNLSSSDIGVADATHTHTASDITDFPTLATVATSGSYNDLSNKPTIPSAVQPTTTTPKMDGTAAVGSETKYAKGDHVHPTDTSRVPTTRKINGLDLTVDRNLVTEGSDVTTGGKRIEFATPTGTMHAYDDDAIDGKMTNVGQQLAQVYVPKTTTVNGFALSDDIVLDATSVSAIPASQKGAIDGVCPLNANSKVDSQYLPSYVDDVIEAYPVSGATALSAGWLSATSGGSALTSEAGKIYVLMADSGDYSANTQFRWGGSAYVKLNDGGVSSITNAEIDTIVAS